MEDIWELINFLTFYVSTYMQFGKVEKVYVENPGPLWAFGLNY